MVTLMMIIVVMRKGVKGGPKCLFKTVMVI